VCEWQLRRRFLPVTRPATVSVRLVRRLRPVVLTVLARPFPPPLIRMASALMMARRRPTATACVTASALVKSTSMARRAAAPRARWVCRPVSRALAEVSAWLARQPAVPLTFAAAPRAAAAASRTPIASPARTATPPAIALPIKATESLAPRALSAAMAIASIACAAIKPAPGLARPARRQRRAPALTACAAALPLALIPTTTARPTRPPPARTTAPVMAKAPAGSTSWARRAARISALARSLRGDN
jgi:hypothetical protein